MAALTDSKYDVYNWVIKVIDSCNNNNYYHSKAVDNLISNFYDRYDDWQLTRELRVYSIDKY